MQNISFYGYHNGGSSSSSSRSSFESDLYHSNNSSTNSSPGSFGGVQHTLPHAMHQMQMGVPLSLSAHPYGPANSGIFGIPLHLMQSAHSKAKQARKPVVRNSARQQRPQRRSLEMQPGGGGGFVSSFSDPMNGSPEEEFWSKATLDPKVEPPVGNYYSQFGTIGTNSGTSHHNNGSYRNLFRA